MSPDLTRLAAALFLGLAAAVSASAQTLPDRDDLEALRFYLQEDNDAAMASELRRLRQTYPDWVPPTDLDTLLQDALGPIIDEIYALIADGRFEEARVLIAETEADGSWSPPQEMTDLLRLSEAQRTFDRAAANGDAATAIGIARAVPGLIACEAVNNAWLLADMHVLQDNADAAIEVYRAVLRTCRDVETLVATLEKADQYVDLETLAMLAETATASAPQAAGRLREVEDRLRAGRGAAPRWPDGEGAIPLGTIVVPRTAEPAADLAAPAVSLRPTPRPTAPGAGAAVAPRSAPATTRSAAPASGTLAAARQAAEAGQWARCLTLTQGAQRGALVYQRGWCAYNAGRSMEAVAAFRMARDTVGDPTQRRDAGYGMMLSLLQLNMTEEAAQFAAALPLTHEQRVEIEGQILDQRGVRAYENREYWIAIAMFDEHRRLTGVQRSDLALLKGYALLNLGNRAAAREVFERLHNQLETSQTRAALRAAR